MIIPHRSSFTRDCAIQKGSKALLTTNLLVVCVYVRCACVCVYFVCGHLCSCESTSVYVRRAWIELNKFQFMTYLAPISNRV